MLETALNVSIALLLGAVFLNLYRLLRGPSILDRVAALDTLYINAVALIVLLGLQLRTTLYFEAAMLIALMGFVGTVAFCKYVLRGDVIE